MYAGTRVKWHEILMPESNKASLDDTMPLFLCVFSADKGTEEVTELVYSDFKKMYGNTADFFKHGQPLIQAHSILASGGRVLGKRVVAPDAKLANVIITVDVTSVNEQKLSPDGKPLYIDGFGKETTEYSETPAMHEYAKLKYKAVTVPEATSVLDVEAHAAELMTESTFPLFIICDNGRGTSIKKVRITPDYAASKNMSYMMYNISDIENTSIVETQRFAMDPTAVHMINGQRRNMLLGKHSMIQLHTGMFEEGAEAFIKKLIEITHYSREDLYKFDILFGRTVKKRNLDAIAVDNESEDSIDITTEYGIPLPSGTNGSFGEAPFPGENDPVADWTNEAIKFINGTFSPEIFDLDQYKIDFCVDANYPFELKNAIVELADFRGDFYYLRDLGLHMNSINDVVDVVDDLSDMSWPRSPFVGDYMSTYDILDGFSHKQIKVTMTYGMAALLTNHFTTNVAAPLAGEFNKFVVSNAIPGTLNIIPRVTPKVDQKEILDDMHVNFMNLTSDRRIAVQSTYTSQDHLGPLSYAGNVIATQVVIKAIRRYCPKIRFMLMDPGEADFGKYKVLIEDNVIARYAANFKHIELVYTRNDEEILRKEFHASLVCYYRDFPQAEVFDVFAVEGSPDTNPFDPLTYEEV